MRIFILLIILASPSSLFSQQVIAEYDKTRDLSRYKTFTMGETEIITPKDERQLNEDELKKIVNRSILEELKEKGLQHVDSAGDLVVSYVVGSMARTDFGQLGPLGMTPGNASQTWSRDYRMGSLIIDLNDKNDNLIWRVNANTSSNSVPIEKMIEEVVGAGFKKFSIKPKKVKKKK
ncbi:MAG: DUF4136 domain-containing protein [Cyclobacteriaceae bacterium]|nr:DUF4136 domain-containing protein [Cyclobacteriaceae bacterium]